MFLALSKTQPAAAQKITPNPIACEKGASAAPVGVGTSDDGKRRTLGDEHPSTLDATSNLAVLLHRQGKLDEADPLYCEALAGRRRALGGAHSDTLGSLNDLASLREEQGLEFAEPLYREALSARRRTLGDAHPDTLATIHNLAGLLWSRGKVGEAEPLMREALGGLRRARGDAHPDTVASMADLACILLELGRAGEAAPLRREAALAARRRTLSDGHHDARSTAAAVACAADEAEVELQVEAPPARNKCAGAAAAPTRHVRFSSGAGSPFARASARATGAMRGWLAGVLGGPREAEALCAALWADGAVIAGSSALYCMSPVAPAWAPGDIDVWLCGGRVAPNVVAFFEGLASARGAAAGADLGTALAAALREAAPPTAVEPGSSSMVRALASRAFPAAAAPARGGAFTLQLIASAFADAPSCVAGFDITCCSVAFDGRAVWALAEELGAGGERRAPGVTHLNPVRNGRSSFAQLARTRERLEKYAARGEELPPRERDALEAQLRALAAAPALLVAACAGGRLKEARALLEAGADATPLALAGDCARVAPCAACGASRRVPVFPRATQWRGEGGVNDFRAVLLEEEEARALGAPPRSAQQRAARVGDIKAALPPACEAAEPCLAGCAAAEAAADDDAFNCGPY